jgi:hypothetical protein
METRLLHNGDFFRLTGTTRSGERFCPVDQSSGKSDRSDVSIGIFAASTANMMEINGFWNVLSNNDLQVPCCTDRKI